MAETGYGRGTGWVLALLLVLGAGLRGCGDTAGTNSPGFALEVEGSVEGRVYGKADGAGLGGAILSLEGDGPSRQATAAFDGRFEIRKVRPGAYRLRAEAPGFVAAASSVFVSPGASHGEELGLQPALDRGEVRLRVVSAPSGVPVPDVSVRVVDTFRVALGDGSGRVVLGDLALGRLRLLLRASGHSARTVEVLVTPAPAFETEIRLARDSGTLEGVIRGGAGSLPLPLARVSLPGLDLETATDSSGFYRIEDVPAAFSVDVLVDESSQQAQLVTTSVVASRVTTLNVTLLPGFGEIQGTVRQFGGGPIQGASVSIPLDRLTTSTDVTGAYRFPRVPAALSTIMGVSSPGFVPDAVVVVVAPDASLVQDFDLLATVGSLTGSVRTTSGAGIPGALVQFPALARSGATDGSGTYLIPGLAAGLQLASVTGAGFSPLTTTVRIDPGVTRTRDFFLVPP